ncbi:MAG: hypothetical protein [Enterobacter phage ENC9]|nr:MAG: hypothetical protein [Enterobacter phage ENC9]
MNINTNSWHYKLVKNTFTTSKGVPRSLCPYMRAVLYRIMFFGVTGTGLTLMLSNLLVDPMIGLGIAGIWAYVASFFASIVMLAVILGGACAIVFGGVWVYQRIQDWWEDRKYDKELERERLKEQGIEPKQPNIVFAFVKAKHDKFCPTLNFTTPEDKE